MTTPRCIILLTIIINSLCIGMTSCIGATPALPLPASSSTISPLRPEIVAIGGISTVPPTSVSNQLAIVDEAITALATPINLEATKQVLVQLLSTKTPPPSPTPKPTHTGTPTPTNTPPLIPPTNTWTPSPTRTLTASPTNTPTPPSPSPTHTPTPSSTSTLTPTPSVTTTPILLPSPTSPIIIDAALRARLGQAIEDYRTMERQVLRTLDPVAALQLKDYATGEVLDVLRMTIGELRKADAYQEVVIYRFEIETVAFRDASQQTALVIAREEHTRRTYRSGTTEPQLLYKEQFSGKVIYGLIFHDKRWKVERIRLETGLSS